MGHDLFSALRYTLSHLLPGTLQGLNHPKAVVEQSHEGRNWIHSLQVDAGDAPYRIFFELRRAPAQSRHLQDLELTVESAYLKGAEFTARGKISFLLLAGKTYLGEPVATRR